ncbi:hypothetical protein GCM10023186_20370 [Hymenobacter koreensis]|uniref:Uncharacterized protein n=1 Tax=Hymenobacter koreensis TaxID=1084523 RepID=A0ABP8IYY6_9BACT
MLSRRERGICGKQEKGVSESNEKGSWEFSAVDTALNREGYKLGKNNFAGEAACCYCG